MWVIKNAFNDKFYAGRDQAGNVQTTDSKHYAAHFSCWDNAAYELRLLTGNWVALPKEEA